MYKHLLDDLLYLFPTDKDYLVHAYEQAPALVGATTAGLHSDGRGLPDSLPIPIDDISRFLGLSTRAATRHTRSRPRFYSDSRS